MQTVEINAAVLRWARETAGLSLEEAADRLKISSARGLSAVDRLKALEDGQKLPTRPLLIRMSKQYRRPLLVFYLDAPPRKGDRGEDFRRLPQDYDVSNEGLVDALVRDVRARQSIVRAVLEDEDEATPLPFVSSAAIGDGVSGLAEKIRKGIGFDLNTFREQKGVGEAFTFLRGKVEATGVFVLLIGDLGSHHSTIPVDAFRGFALADEVAPFVIINDQDSRAAWSFTLLHEVAHVWLGRTGISGALAETTLERFCNDVAGTLLLPPAELRDIHVRDGVPLALAIERINAFAIDRNISRAMVAYRLYRAGSIEMPMWSALRAEFRKQWLDNRDRQRELARDQEGGPTYYIVRRHRIGKALVELISRMTASGALTFTKASKVLGVKPRNVPEFLQPTA